jgi:restriction system protein
LKKSRRKIKKQESIIELLFIPLVFLSFYITRSIEKTIIIGAVSAIGLLIVYITIKTISKQKKEKRLRNSGIVEIDKMDGLQFEHYLSALFNALGYKARTTNAAGDYGADLLLTKENTKIVVQAKRYSKNVGIKAIQEIVASKLHYDANDAWVVTNSFYTKPAVALALSNGVRLIDRKELIDFILAINPGAVPTAKEVRETVSPKEIKCPTCKSKMIAKEGKYGSFYGCSNHPICKVTLNI